MKHLPLVAASSLFVAICGSSAYWGMQWFQPPARPVAAAPKATPSPLNIEAAAGLFGGPPAGAAVATTFQLKGVIDDGPESVAILAAEGKPPAAVGVDQEAAPGVTVREIHLTWVVLNERGTVRRLDLPLAAIAGLQIVAAGPDDRFDAPGRQAASRTPVTTVARSGGAMPLPVANPDVAPAPSQAPPQGISAEMIDRIRMSRPSGIGPGAFGAPRT